MRKRLAFLLYLTVLAALFVGGCGSVPLSISSLTATPAKVATGGTTTISCAAATSSSGDLSYAWTADGGALSSTAGTAVSWTAPSTQGTYTITVVVSDGSGSVTASLQVVVTDSNYPNITKITVAPEGEIVVGETVSISCEASDGTTSTSSTETTDPTLSYRWSCDGGSLSSTSGSNINWTAPSTAGSYKVTVVVSDGTNDDVGTQEMTVVYADVPIINSLSASPAKIAVNKYSALTCSASDPNSLSLSYSWRANGGTLLSSTGTAVTWEAPATAGSYAVTVTVTNSKSASTSEVLNIPVVVPGTPTISNLTVSSPTVSTGGSVTLTCYATDPDGLNLTYSWSSSGGGSYSSTSANTATWVASTTTGTYTLTVTVSNGTASASRSVSVEIE